MADNLELLAAKQKVEDILLRNTGSFAGVGARKKDDTVTVYLREYTQKSINKAYDLLNSNKANGHELTFIQSGHVTALSTTEYHRPLYGGDSISHRLVTAGTMGCVVYNPASGELYGLTNNHIAAAASSDIYRIAQVGDIIYAPGCYDTGSCQYPIGKLAKFIPFNEQGTNFVDCAIFKPDNTDDLTTEIYGIGTLTGYIDPAENMPVKKFGRTTGLTVGSVSDMYATMEVDYGGRILKFTNCIITETMADGGDSGSALVNNDNKLVGLLFAGSDTITVYNRSAYVLNQLGVTVTQSEQVPEVEYPQQSRSTTVQDDLQSFAIVSLTVGVMVGLVQAVSKK